MKNDNAIGKNVVVFGGSSWIGRNLVKRLVEQNMNVTVTYRPNSLNYKRLYNEVKDRVNYIELDICNNRTYKNLERISQCDYLFLASWAGTNLRDASDINNRSAQGLLRCLELLLDWTDCKKVIMLGTQAEYGFAKGRVTEETKCNPVSAYGKGKLWFNNQAITYCGRQNVTYLEFRIHSVYGPERNGMIGYVVSELIQNRSTIVMQTDCNQKWDFLYIDDLVDGLLRGMESDLPAGSYNIGFWCEGEKDITLKNYILKARNVINPAIKIQWGDRTESVPPDFLFDSSKFRNATGWKPRIIFEEGIKRMATIDNRA